jgi:phosphoribosylamine--glycine ligase
MKILLLGSGGREHALAWKIAQSPLCGELFIAPGNAGTADYGTNLPVSVDDFPGIKRLCLEQDIDMVIPGPEVPLVQGIADFFSEDAALAGIPVIGPGRSGAMLEGSKAFAKDFMVRHGIPTALYREFSLSNFEEGKEYLENHSMPVVLKADGLAAGKGVVICQTQEEAVREFEQMVREGKFGDAGSKVVVEEFLEGIELSVFVLTDGSSWMLLPEAKDYKRIGEGDTGPNTGGMGAVSPVPFADKAFMEKVSERIIRPTMDGIEKDGLDYQGFIFFGLIRVGEDPFVIEYNCRLGDPEAEAILPRMKNDIVDLFVAVAEGTLGEKRLQTDERVAATVILVSGGYPGPYEKGKAITGLDRHPEGALVFHAGTALRDGSVVTHGGRVIAVTSLAAGLKDALEQAGREAGEIQFEGRYFRRDIGWEFPA